MALNNLSYHDSDYEHYHYFFYGKAIKKQNTERRSSVSSFNLFRSNSEFTFFRHWATYNMN